MATAYLIEVTINGKAYYVGQGSKITYFPRFFNNAGGVRRVLSNPKSSGYGNSRFGEAHKPSTKIVQIKNLELGLKNSFAKIMTVNEFLTMDFGKNGLKIPNNPRALYMIKLAPGQMTTTPTYVRRVGMKTAKFGHQWNSGGFVRSHITARLERLKSNYLGAEVLEIEMDTDGFTPKVVKSYPIVDFYCASASSRLQYEQKFGKYNPTSAEFA